MCFNEINTCCLSHRKATEPNIHKNVSRNVAYRLKKKNSCGTEGKVTLEIFTKALLKLHIKNDDETEQHKIFSQNTSKWNRYTRSPEYSSVFLFQPVMPSSKKKKSLKKQKEKRGNAAWKQQCLHKGRGWQVAPPLSKPSASAPVAKLSGSSQPSHPLSCPCQDHGAPTLVPLLPSLPCPHPYPASILYTTRHRLSQAVHHHPYFPLVSTTVLCPLVPSVYLLHPPLHCPCHLLNTLSPPISPFLPCRAIVSPPTRPLLLDSSRPHPQEALCVTRLKKNPSLISLAVCIYMIMSIGFFSLSQVELTCLYIISLLTMD